MDEVDEKVGQSKKILDAAYECISAKGYANVSLREIAERAGVVLSQLNYYYGNKEGLFKEVIKLMMAKYLVEVERCLNKGETAKEKMSNLIKFFKEMLRNNPGLFRLFYDFNGLALWSPPFRDLLRKLFKDLSGMIEKTVLKNTQLKDSMQGYPPKFLARMILGAMFGTAIQVILDREEENLPDALNAVQIIFE
ncbi:MAG: TetR/AcrR family transcriptional regulator [Firmicutes bacterium HGW-Firmicutes-8]|nr:MAG: TetR/AcrR family transcriptional regulator [Firmicutes bacterium HGW-Firmicutes-8]